MSECKHIRSVAYKAVTAKLKELDTFDTMDLWKGQVTTGKQTKSDPVCYPAAFVSIANIDWQDMTMNVQEGELKITIYVFFNKFGDTFDGATDQEDSLFQLDTLNDTINAIQWLFKENYFTELTQTREQDLTERYERPAFALTFEAQCFNKLKLPNYVHN